MYVDMRHGLNVPWGVPDEENHGESVASLKYTCAKNAYAFY